MQEIDEDEVQDQKAVDEKSTRRRNDDGSRVSVAETRRLIREFREERFPGDAFGRIIEKPSDGKIGERRVANRP